ncbi:AtpZ/AtpI family protein [Patescibacteria group bacterium]|nr:AtpZ/AtpI family protein [Patescibacteria group bacterium]
MENQKNKAPLADKSFASALGLAWELGYAIALPLIILAVGGRWLDKALDSTPIFMLIGVVLSMFVTSWMIYKKLVKLMHYEEDEELANKVDNKQDSSHN